jgi:hypothetical protein
MHLLLGATLHVTVLAIIGYFLLYTASKADGLVALIGRVLGLWVFLLAILSVVAVATMPMSGGKPFGVDMMHGRGMGWMHRWDRDGAPDQQVAPATTPPGAAPATPSTPAPAPVKKTNG